MIYVDSLNFISVVLLSYRKIFVKINTAYLQIMVLNSIESGLYVNWLKFIGFKVLEADYYVGCMTTRKGNNLWKESLLIAANIAHHETNELFKNHQYFSNLNTSWNKNTIKLFITKFFMDELDYKKSATVLKVMIVDSLESNNKDKTILLIKDSLSLSKKSFSFMSKNVNVITYRGLKPLRLMSLRSILYIVFFKIKRVIVKKHNRCANKQLPGIAVLSENSISLDEFNRSEPHWLIRDKYMGNFKTIIFNFDGEISLKENKDLERYNIFTEKKDSLYAYKPELISENKINSSLLKVVFYSIFGDQQSRIVSSKLILLLLDASLLTGFFQTNKIVSFVTAKNYDRFSDAAQLIASYVDVKTFSYQYSTLSMPNPLMLSTADVFFTFSSFFHDKYRANGISPLNFIDIGYLYDRSFRLLRKKVNNILNLDKKFVIGFLDENVLNDRFSSYNSEEHYRDMKALCDFAIKYEDVLIVVKPQFVRNTPSKLYPNSDWLQRAISLGKFIELSSGEYRNKILPAEVGMMADVTISHAIGGTAALEVALSGNKCILVDSNLPKDSVSVYRDMNVLYDNLDDAISALIAYKEGRNGYENIGIWGDEINLFDKYNDGRSSHRFFNHIVKTFE